MLEDAADILQLTVEIVSAHVSKTKVRAEDLPELIRSIRATLAEGDQASPEPVPEPEGAKLTPAQVRKSIRDDALVSFIDGKPYKMLKRHLAANGLTFEQYRTKYGLPSDYPVIAPSYSRHRSEVAGTNGFGGRSRAGSAPVPVPEADKVDAAPATTASPEPEAGAPSSEG